MGNSSGKFLPENIWEILAGKSCRKLLWEILARKYCGKILGLDADWLSLNHPICKLSLSIKGKNIFENNQLCFGN